jgi:hypothetical protein
MGEVYRCAEKPLGSYFEYIDAGVSLYFDYARAESKACSALVITAE